MQESNLRGDNEGSQVKRGKVYYLRHHNPCFLCYALRVVSSLQIVIDTFIHIEEVHAKFFGKLTFLVDETSFLLNADDKDAAAVAQDANGIVGITVAVDPNWRRCSCWAEAVPAELLRKIGSSLSKGCSIFIVPHAFI